LFSIFTLGSFDNRPEERTIKDLSGTAIDFASYGFGFMDWASAVCLIDFFAMILAVIFVLTWNGKSQNITDRNDANNQTP
jgi:hypothetical protein